LQILLGVRPEEEHGMGRRFWIVAALCAAFAAAGAGTVLAQGMDIPKSLVKFTGETLASIGKDPQLVAFVETSNANPQDVALLKALDAKWQKKDGIEDFVKELLGNPTSARLARLIAGYPYIPEAFIMDAQGTIVGETNRTSTYWKGEQTKFTAAYKGGVGATWYGKLEYDASTKANLVQISVPVVKGGRAIGAICFGINVDEWEKR
jgi:hypothetical protein